MGVVIDTETTGLLMPRLAANELQPQLIEIYLGRFDEATFEIVQEYNTLIKPVTKWGEQIKLEDPKNKLAHICRITNVYDHMLDNQPTFDEIYEDVFEFCDGEDLILGHNIMFDLEVMYHNFVRIGKKEYYPDIRRRVCTVELSYPLKKRRMKLAELYAMATGAAITGAHRARTDALACLTGYKWLVEEGL